MIVTMSPGLPLVGDMLEMVGVASVVYSKMTVESGRCWTMVPPTLTWTLELRGASVLPVTQVMLSMLTLLTAQVLDPITTETGREVSRP